MTSGPLRWSMSCATVAALLVSSACGDGASTPSADRPPVEQEPESPPEEALASGQPSATSEAPPGAPTSAGAGTGEAVEAGAGAGDEAPDGEAPDSEAPDGEAPDGEADAAPPRRVLMIGDSSAAGMRWTAGASEPLQGAEFTADLESCRRLVAESCIGREGHRPATALDVIEWHADEGHDTLVMLTGYNDIDEDFEAAFDQIVAAATSNGIRTILWTTYREDVGYELPDGAATSYAAMNELVRARADAAGQPELHVLDWWTYTAEADDWFADDGVHTTDAGAYGLADLVSRSLAALDGVPCPAPWRPGEQVDDPCPTPYGLPSERGGVPPVAELHP